MEQKPTPRTDKFLEEHDQGPELKRLIEFTRKLEAELNESNRLLTVLNPFVDYDALVESTKAPL